MRQRQFKMPAKNTEKREKAEDEQLEQSQSETERYLLQIDKQSKRSFKTPEQPGQLRWKSIPFPTLQVSIYDTVIGSRCRCDRTRIVPVLTAEASLRGFSMDMSAVTISILIIGAAVLIVLAIVYFGLVRRRRG